MGRFKDFVEKTSYLTVGAQFAFSIFIGLGIGYWLDKQFKTFPWLTIVWLIIGLIAGFKNVYREIKKVVR